MSIRPRRRALQHHIERYPRWLRILAGVGLVLGGLLGFLPVLGFWMIPLGLLVLSRDLHSARRLRRRLQVYLQKRKQRLKRDRREQTIT